MERKDYLLIVDERAFTYTSSVRLHSHHTCMHRHRHTQYTCKPRTHRFLPHRHQHCILVISTHSIHAFTIALHDSPAVPHARHSSQHIIISFDCLLSTSLVTSFHFLSPFVSRTPKDEKKNEESTYATSVLAVADSYFHVGGSFLFVL